MPTRRWSFSGNPRYLDEDRPMVSSSRVSEENESVSGDLLLVPTKTWTWKECSTSPKLSSTTGSGARNGSVNPPTNSKPGRVKSGKAESGTFACATQMKPCFSHVLSIGIEQTLFGSEALTAVPFERILQAWYAHTSSPCAFTLPLASSAPLWGQFSRVAAALPSASRKST